MLARTGTIPQRQVIPARLEALYLAAPATPAPEVHRLAATIDTW